MRGAGLVIFDLDGTLFRTETVTVPAVQESFRAFGLAAPPAAEICDLIGRPGAELYTFVRRLAPRERAEELAAAIDAAELGLVERKGELYRGVPEALALLHSRSRLAICTNGPPEWAARVASAHGIRARFDAVRGRESEGDTKANMVRELLSHLDARPALVVGDRREDVEAAHANGLRALGCAYGYGAPDELARADATIDDPSELAEAVAAALAAPPYISV